MIGIDLGTTNSLIAVWVDGESTLIPNVHGNFVTPSVVSVDDSGRVLVGEIAKERLLTHPDKTCANFKRDMGAKKAYQLGKKSYYPEELSALLLRQLKVDAEEYLGKPIDKAVISVPAYFNNTQRQATKLAGELAGLTVERIINEPTAAALAYGLHDDKKESISLVFDLGGGTFDVSIIEIFNGIMEIKASTGNNHLGGEDFTHVLINLIESKTGLRLVAEKDSFDNESLHALIRKKAEDAKFALTRSKISAVNFSYKGKEYHCEITEADFESNCQELLRQLRIPIERVLRDARLSSSDLDSIVLVGGSTRMPIVKRFVATLFGRLPLTHLNPDEVVGIGACVQAALKSRDKALSDVVVTDVCPYTLGTSMVSDIVNGRSKPFYQPIIERNTVIPVSRTVIGSNAVDNQSFILIKVYQGEHFDPEENIKLGELRVNVPKGRAGEIGVDIRYTYDINGLLEVEALVHKTKEVTSLVIDNGNNNFSAKEIKSCLKKIQGLKVHPRDEEKNRVLIERAERLFSELTGDVRDHITYLLGSFNLILEKHDPIETAKFQEQFAQELLQIEIQNGLQ